MEEVGNLVGEELAFAQQAYGTLIDFFLNYGFQVIGAIIILFIGIWISGRLGAGATALCERNDIDITLGKFTGSITRVIVLTFFIIISLGKFGISVAPFIAAIGAIGLGAGLAVQGLLSNVSAGIAIIITRPFKVGNTITLHDISGEVTDIKLASTILATEDGEQITLPNKHVVGEIMMNSFENRLVESIVGISYDDDPDRAIAALQQAVGLLDCVSDDPAPMVGIEAFGESSIDIGVRCWVPTSRYVQSKYRINSTIHETVKIAGLTIPFPQRDVNFSKQN
jgi:small conductance mechanosensitive channel